MIVWKPNKTIWVCTNNVKTLLTISYFTDTRYTAQHGQDHLFGGKLSTVSTDERPKEIEVEASNIFGFDRITVDKSWTPTPEDVERKEEPVPSFYFPELESTYEVT